MTREILLLITVQSSGLFIGLWLIFRLIPTIPANVKAWLWRLAFLKPVMSLLPFGVIVLRVLPAPPSAPMVETRTTEFVMGQPLSVPVDVAEPIAIDPMMAMWTLGFVIVAGMGFRATSKSLQVAKRAMPIQRQDLLDCLGDLSARAGLKHKLVLCESNEVASAMLVMGRRSRIILPTHAVETSDFQDLRLMLAHEVAHAARKDLAWLGLASAVQSLLFFNPIVWVAGKCARQDHESATDLRASELAGVPIQTYADMLVRAIIVPRPSFSVGSLTMGASYRSIHRRLEAMKHFNTTPTPARKAVIFAIALGTLAMLPAYQLAAAWPDQYLETDLSALQEPSSSPAVIAPRADGKGAIARTGTRLAPQRESRDLAVLPIKVVTEKNGKKRYYIRTKKGLAEITLPIGQKDLIQTRTGFAIAPGHPLTIAPGQAVEERVVAGHPVDIVPGRAVEKRIVAGHPVDIAPYRAVERRVVAGQPLEISPGRIVEGKPIGSKPIERQLAPLTAVPTTAAGSPAQIAPREQVPATLSQAPRVAPTRSTVATGPGSEIAPARSTSRPATLIAPTVATGPIQTRSSAGSVEQVRPIVATTASSKVVSAAAQASRSSAKPLTYETIRYQSVAEAYPKVYLPTQNSNAKVAYQLAQGRYIETTGAYVAASLPRFRGSGVIEVVLPDGSRKSFKLKQGSVYEFRNGVPVEVTKRSATRVIEKRADRTKRPVEIRKDRSLTERSVDPFHDLKGDGG